MGAEVNYYNEFEPFAAEWLARLAVAGHIGPGRVDSRSIKEVKAEDVRDARRAHFFAGIGVWEHALRLAGWPDDRPVWTGSCPCQPFSVAGRGKGTDDERHLWPEWFRLIRECLPPVVLGEQVASPDGLAWLDAVRADLEGAGYAVGAADLCAAGVGAPHIRQRLYFVGVRLADAREGGRGWGANVGRDERNREDGGRPEGVGVAESRGAARGLADADATGRLQLGSGGLRENGHAPQRHDVDGRGAACGLGHADGEHAGRNAGAGHREEAGARLRGGGDKPRAPGAAGQRLGEPIREGLEGHAGHGDDGHQPGRDGAQPHGPAPTSGFWGGPDWVACRDGKLRPVESGTFPLAHGATQRVGRLRAYGNAIVSEVAATFIKAVMQTLDSEIE